ncbi:hypothetical protein ACEQ8H_008842 [Pleosporales sp. CAS-2024a]
MLPSANAHVTYTLGLQRQVHASRGTEPRNRAATAVPGAPSIFASIGSTFFTTSVMPRSHSADQERESAAISERGSRHHRSRPHHARRSRSPRRDGDRHKHRRRRSRSPVAKPPVELPYKAKPLSKRQFDEYKPLFQSYLGIQKHMQLDELDEREAKGRWKSFVSKWNHGGLARSWYDPCMLKTAQETAQFYQSATSPRAKRASPQYTSQQDSSDGSDDDFGPAPPTAAERRTGHGPTVPRLDDLAYRDEMREEDGARDRSSYVDDMHHERKMERKAQKERLEELVPRADAGSRERQLEKKREVTSTLQSFRDAKESGHVEVAEADLMGDDGIDLYKKKKKEEQRKKSEREIRREEISRAREAERNQRLAERREKENKTMEFLMQIAKERFG